MILSKNILIINESKIKTMENKTNVQNKYKSVYGEDYDDNEIFDDSKSNIAESVGFLKARDYFDNACYEAKNALNDLVVYGNDCKDYLQTFSPEDVFGHYTRQDLDIYALIVLRVRMKISNIEKQLLSSATKLATVKGIRIFTEKN